MGRATALASAYHSLLAGELPGALDSLVAAFGARPMHAIIGALEAVAARAVLPVETEPEERWLEVAARGRAIDVPWLLRTLFDGAPPDGVAARIEALARRPPDPRVAAHLVGLVAAPPFDEPSAFAFWDALFDALARSRDPRLPARLREARAALEPLAPMVRARLVAGVERAAAAIEAEPEPTLTREERRLLDAITRVADRGRGSRAPADRVAALEAQVYADPDDDGARLVLADLLQEHGDLRGQMIALQIEATRRPLTDGEQARVDRIIAATGERLLGPLAPWVRATEAQFERGFPARVSLVDELDDSIIALDAWATVTELDVTFRPSAATQLGLPSLRSVRRLTGAPIGVLAALDALAPERPLRLEHLSLSQVPAANDFARLEALIERGVLPSLTSVAVHGPSRAMRGRVGAYGRLAGRLSRLRIHSNNWEVTATVEKLTPIAPAILELELGQVVLRLRRDAPDAIELDYEGGLPPRVDRAWVDAFVARLPPSLTVTRTPRFAAAFSAR